MSLSPKYDEVSQAIGKHVPPDSDHVDELTPTEIFRKLWRQKHWIVGTVLVINFFSWVILQQLTPLYTAVAEVMIGAREEKVIDMENMLSGITGSNVAIETEAHVIRSRGLAEKTIDKLGLIRYPEFNFALQPPSALRRFLDIRGYLPQSRQAFFPDTSQDQQLTNEEKQAIEKEIVIGEFLKRLNVAPKEDSLVIRVGFTSRDPHTAALVVNTLNDYYIVSQLDAKLDAAKRASSWLYDRLVKLRAQVDASAKAVEKFREEGGLLQSKGDVTLAEKGTLRWPSRKYQSST